MTGRSRTLFLGHFGSGKTEVAIHFALSLGTEQKRALLVDLDFITPYYRCREAAAELSGCGVEVLAPDGDLARSDLPVLATRAVEALLAYEGPVVVDVGGDEGARVIGSLCSFLTPGRFEALLVVNPHRPGTQTPAQIAAYAGWLERAARLRLTGLVNNANVGPLTTPDHVREGLKPVAAAAAILGLPVRFSAAMETIAGAMAELPLLSLRLRMRPPWEAGMEPWPPRRFPTGKRNGGDADATD